MDVRTLNSLLASGEIDHPEMWPRLEEFKSKAVTFDFEFGLEKLPTDPGLIIVRGPRQYGKSTWLDLRVRETISIYGKGTAFYLNGDEIASIDELEREIQSLLSSFNKGSKIKRIFIDEITAVPNWEKCIKRLWDRGDIRDILIVTTGSKAFDLRRGSERLPGRKGKLEKSEFVFLPICYRQFHSKCHEKFHDRTWLAYLITGGSPVLANDLFEYQRLTEASIKLVRDWVLGEVILSGRSRLFLYNVMESLFRFGASPVGYAKLARESGLANNTVAAGYIDQLADLLAVLPAWQWDHSRKIFVANKPCKFHFINLAVALAFHKSSIRHLDEFENSSPEMKGVWLEWLVAQEVWRRTVLEHSEEEGERMGFWKSENHEIDFVTADGHFIEVKWGKAGPLDFSWFSKTFPKSDLTVICQTPFETNHIRGITPHQFLLGK